MTNKRGMFTKSTKSIIDRNKVVSMSDFLDESKEDDNIYYIPVNEIQDNPFQPRKHFDEKKLQELSNSIKQSGVIQPIVVRQENELVILVAGERRLRASKLAGLEKIPAIISKGNPIEISLIENIQRENLEPFEEAEALKKMIDEYDYTQEKLALVVSKSQTIISRSLSLNKIPEELRLKYAHAHISKRSLIEVAKQKTFDLMSGLFEKIILGNLKSDEVREITKKQNKKEETKEKIAFKR
ncbi:MAG: hypothetical protein B6I28_06070 [Fusobacteriia bacterium 4572_132]|nr:MAG: hypothetical protein B6I28_06070 [Fusobacteriia bacterium 4572_132]